MFIQNLWLSSFFTCLGDEDGGEDSRASGIFFDFPKILAVLFLFYFVFVLDLFFVLF